MLCRNSWKPHYPLAAGPSVFDQNLRMRTQYCKEGICKEGTPLTVTLWPISSIALTNIRETRALFGVVGVWLTAGGCCDVMTQLSNTEHAQRRPQLIIILLFIQYMHVL